MPTYEYVCTDCQNQWEEIQKISEDAIEVCPKCGKSTAKRQISGGSFILKGGGWYADLYSSTPKGGAKESSGTKTESAAKTESATPAAKTETSTSTPSTSGSSGSSGSSGGSST